MRIFKTKSLARFTRQHGVDDASLVEAVGRARRGLIDADFGGQIIKQRVARPGQGRRGGFRLLLGFRSDRAVFLFGFAKNERENIDADELTTLRELVSFWLGAGDAAIATALKHGQLIEVHDGKEG